MHTLTRSPPADWTGAVIRGGMEEVAEAIPEMGKGPLEKAKEALSG